MIDATAEFTPAAKNKFFSFKTFDDSENSSSSDSDAYESNSPVVKRESMVRDSHNVKPRQEILENDMMSSKQTEEELTKNRGPNNSKQAAKGQTYC